MEASQSDDSQANNSSNREPGSHSRASSTRCTDGRGHNCLYCGKWFLRSSDVRRHFLVHTGEKPYACPRCPFRASLKSNMKQHVTGVHKIPYYWNNKIYCSLKWASVLSSIHICFIHVVLQELEKKSRVICLNNSHWLSIEEWITVY